MALEQWINGIGLLYIKNVWCDYQQPNLFINESAQIEDSKRPSPVKANKHLLALHSAPCTAF